MNTMNALKGLGWILLIPIIVMLLMWEVAGLVWLSRWVIGSG